MKEGTTVRDLLIEQGLFCPVCKEPSAWAAIDNKPCLECCKARAKVATSGRGRCTCPKAKKQPRTVETRFRSWVACDRCLGTIKQLT